MNNTFSIESILFKDMYTNNNKSISSNTKITKSLDDCVYDAYKSSEDLKFYETYTMINDYNNTQKLRMLNKLRYATNNIKNKQAHNSCESYIRSIEEESNVDNGKKKNIFIRILQGIAKVILGIIGFIFVLIGAIIGIVILIASLPFIGIVRLIAGRKKKKFDKEYEEAAKKMQKDYEDAVNKMKDDDLDELINSLFDKETQDRVYNSFHEEMWNKNDANVVDVNLSHEAVYDQEDSKYMGLNLTKFNVNPGNTPLSKHFDSISKKLKKLVDSSLANGSLNSNDVKTITTEYQSVISNTSDFSKFFVNEVGVNKDSIMSYKNINKNNVFEIFKFIGLSFEKGKVDDKRSACLKNFKTTMDSIKKMTQEFSKETKANIDKCMDKLQNSDDIANFEYIKQCFSGSNTVLKNIGVHIKSVNNTIGGVKRVLDNLKRSMKDDGNDSLNMDDIKTQPFSL